MTSRRETKAFPISAVKAVDTETGTFEAVVSVFGNVDHHGDRIVPGAFANSLERWRQTGDPIPVIFSHQWHDPKAYLGTADPADVVELAPGDDRLPNVIRDNGGLYVKGRIDTSEPEGRKAAKLLRDRVVREFSFAYDVLDEARASDGYNDLLELDLIEVGPTLKGANPLTQLVAAKARERGVEAKATEALELLAELVADVPTDLAGKARFKAYVRPAGSIEENLDAIRSAIIDETVTRFGDDLYTVGVEATYGDRVIVYVELWDEPLGGGSYFEVAYTAGDDDVEVGDWTAIDFEVSIVPRVGAAAGDGFRQKEGRRNAGSDLARIQSIHNLTRELGADCEEPDGTGEEDPDGADAVEPTAKTIPAPSVLLATLDAELMDLEA